MSKLAMPNNYPAVPQHFVPYNSPASDPQSAVHQAHYPAPHAAAPAAASQPSDSCELNYADMHQMLSKTEGEIKKIRGWHGSRLAVAGGVAGGLTLAAGGIAAAAVLTGVTGGAFAVGGVAVGAAALGGGAAAAGGGMAAGGAVAGWVKTQHGKHACKKDPQLMQKIALLQHMRAKLKAEKYSTGISPEQRALYRALKKVTNKVDRGSLKQAASMTGSAAAGVVGAAAGTVLVAGLVLVAAGAGEPGSDCFCCYGPQVGTGFGCGGGGGSGRARVSAPVDPQASTGFTVTRDQLAQLTA